MLFLFKTQPEIAWHHTAKWQHHPVKRRENPFSSCGPLNLAKVSSGTGARRAFFIVGTWPSQSFSRHSNYRLKPRFGLSMWQPWIKLNFTFWGAAVLLESTKQLCYHPQPEAVGSICSSPPAPGTHRAGWDTATALYKTVRADCAWQNRNPWS